VTVPEQTTRWRLRRSDSGLQLDRLRAFGSETFTWAELLRAPLAETRVYALYFPSRFDLPVDAAATESLRRFGGQTSNRTSVDFWDPQDEHFSEALKLFSLRTPPALVLATGLQAVAEAPGAVARPDMLYCISFADQAVLTDRGRMAAAVNVAHEVLMQCDSKEIVSHIRGQKIKALLAAVARAAGMVRDEVVKLHPTFGLPGGYSIGLG
jgi:hypothetical protein